MSNGNGKLGLVEKIGYGFGDLASCIFWQTITLYLLFFYTDVFGLAAAAAGGSTHPGTPPAVPR